MYHFPHNQVFLLPHADTYRQLYDLSVAEIVQTLNEPDLHEGLADDRYTAEKQIGDHRIYVYYYLTYPVQVTDNTLYAIVDFIGYSVVDEQPTKKEAVREPKVPSPQG